MTTATLPCVRCHVPVEPPAPACTRLTINNTDYDGPLCGDCLMMASVDFHGFLKGFPAWQPFPAPPHVPPPDATPATPAKGGEFLWFVLSIWAFGVAFGVVATIAARILGGMR